MYEQPKDGRVATQLASKDTAAAGCARTGQCEPQLMMNEQRNLSSLLKCSTYCDSVELSSSPGGNLQLQQGKSYAEHHVEDS